MDYQSSRLPTIIKNEKHINDGEFAKCFSEGEKTVKGQFDEMMKVFMKLF